MNIFGIGKDKPETAIKKISAAQAHELALAERITLIDVRKLEEWTKSGRPQGSHGITLQDQDFEAKILDLIGGDKAQPIAVSCKMGGRSSQAADKAKRAGHLNISDVEGGFNAWLAAGLPIDKGPF